jgi:type IV secretion system protein VirB10
MKRYGDNRDEDAARSDRGGDAMGGGHRNELGDNPYASHARQAAVPDLDAAAPLLRSSDVQRMNRKALWFLAGIVVLLVTSAFWMFSGAAAGTGADAKRQDEKVVIPELPQLHAAAAEPVAPIALQPLSAINAAPELPPLPVQAKEMPPTMSFPPPSQASMAPPVLSLLQRRMDNGEQASGRPGPLDPYTQALLVGMPPLPSNITAPVPPAVADGEASSAQFIDRPDALLVRGTYVRCVLETRIITDVPGFTSCVVTEPIYSINGRNLLLPKGSKASGRYDTDANGPRVAVVWDRITTPTGIDIHMASPGVDNLGGAGHPGDYDAHWPSRVGAALMISLISDAFKYEGETHGPRTTTVSNGVITQAPFDSNTARTLQRLANQALDRSISRPATVTINQGTVVNIYVAKDVDFSAVLTGH